MNMNLVVPLVSSFVPISLFLMIVLISHFFAFIDSISSQSSSLPVFSPSCQTGRQTDRGQLAFLLYIGKRTNSAETGQPAGAYTSTTCQPASQPERPLFGLVNERQCRSLDRKEDVQTRQYTMYVIICRLSFVKLYLFPFIALCELFPV